ncbi:MAG: HAMP domain-containing histidine kinase [Bacteroidaceae bacterium]|nr:HAMP domain-containing histidine kinase [Bacteroidaceae bacterium]
MNRITDFKNIRTALILVAVAIAIFSLLVSHSLVKDLEKEEHVKMEIFADAYRAINEANEDTDLSLVMSVLSGNNTIPVIVLDQDGGIRDYLNIEIRKADTATFLMKRVAQMRDKGNSIRIYHDRASSDAYTEVCFDDSLMISRLTVYPYIQLGVVSLFVLIAIFALLSFKKTEQNRVWVGLSKETAHQLGTPISSLMAWTELLKDKYDDELIDEMGKDVKRLEIIAERFSKVGSMPDPVPEDVARVLEGALGYIEHRSPATVKFVRKFPDKPVEARMNAPLFEWVVENLCKNAVDAMDGKGTLTVELLEDEKYAYIEVADTGKGIHKNSFKTVFQPGYTTKKRGWGLGLSLAKRIVEEYHKGRIFVKKSELGKGTVFRVELIK